MISVKKTFLKVLALTLVLVFAFSSAAMATNTTVATDSQSCCIGCVAGVDFGAPLTAFSLNEDVHSNEALAAREERLQWEESNLGHNHIMRDILNLHEDVHSNEALAAREERLQWEEHKKLYSIIVSVKH